MKMKPLRDRVLVKRLESETITKSGIIIPDSAGEKPMEAKVIATGPGGRSDKGDLIPMTIKKNDLILLAKYSGNEIKIDGDEHLIVREDEILAVIEK